MREVFYRLALRLGFGGRGGGETTPTESFWDREDFWRDASNFWS